jgi:hypothetical protein
MKRIILGGISPGYEFAMQRLIDYGLENIVFNDVGLTKLINKNQELANFGFSGAQYFYCLWFLKNIKEKGYDNFINIGITQVESCRVFDYDKTIESVKNCNYKFGLIEEVA